MASRSRVIGIVLLVLTDVGALIASFAISFYLRFESGLASVAGISSPGTSGYLELGIVITLSAPFLFAASGLYKSTNLNFGLTEYVLVMRSTALLVLAIIFVSFIVGAEPIVSRTWIAIWVVVGVLFLMLGRFVIRRVTTALRRRGTIQESVLLVGADAQGAAIARQLNSIPGVTVRGFLDEFLPAGTKIRNQFTILGSVKQIEMIAERLQVDTVLMIPTAISWESRQDLMLSSLKPGGSKKWKLQLAPGVYEMASLGAELGRVGNIPVLRLHGSSIVGLDALMKRTVDLVLACAMLAIFSPVILSSVLVAKLRGNYALSRKLVSGQNGETFQMLSLNTNPGREGFPDGIARLPMLIHVLKGDMSLVGPRPRGLEDSAATDNPELLAVRPGIISVVPRSVVLGAPEQWTRIEATYTRNYSIWADLAILIRALVMGLRYAFQRKSLTQRSNPDAIRSGTPYDQANSE